MKSVVVEFVDPAEVACPECGLIGRHPYYDPQCDRDHGPMDGAECPSCHGEAQSVRSVRPCSMGCGLAAAEGDIYCDGCGSSTGLGGGLR